MPGEITEHILQLFLALVGINFNSTVRDRLDVAALSDLGNALSLLSDSASWSDDNIISVIDELIGNLPCCIIFHSSLYTTTSQYTYYTTLLYQVFQVLGMLRTSQHCS